MNMNTPVLAARFFTCIAAAAACAAALSSPIQAKDKEVTIAISVNGAGLHLNQPAGARELYRRLQHAAYIACGHGNRVDLVPVADVSGCHEKAVGDAVRSVNRPLLTMIYLETHTPQDAASHGIGVPVLVAAK